MQPRRCQLAVVFCFLFGFHLSATVYFVNVSNPSPAAPYTNWATAALTIQDAINASSDGDQILVTNGLYQTGGQTVNGFALTNRVAIVKAVTIQSVNGAAVTFIQGYQVPGTTNGDSAIRGVYLTNGAALIGFTVTNGATRTNGDYLHEDCGGGCWCESTNALVLNCTIVGNTTKWDGGGAVYGTFSNCTFTANAAGVYGYGGGAYNSILYDCTLFSNWANYGGGANSGILNNCTLTNNTAGTAGGAIGSAGIGTTVNNCLLANNFAVMAGGASHYGVLSNCILTGNSTAAYGYGGGADGGTLNNCIVTNNSAFEGGGAYQASGSSCILNNCIVIANTAATGGGASSSTLNNCLVTGNTASGSGGGSYYGTLNSCTVVGNTAGSGGGTYYSGLTGCIVYFNNAPQYPNYYRTNIITYTCTTPYPAGSGNIGNDPLFMDPIGGNLHLQSNSPCINSGADSSGSSTDLDGNPRVVGGAIDMGAYEFQTPGFTLPYLWAQQYGLSTDGSIDSDGDGMNNWQEWMTGTNPTNAASVLKILSLSNSVSGITVMWQCVPGRTYVLQRSTNLVAQPAFSTISGYIYVFNQTNAVGYKDIGATGPGPYFYRVAVP
ncbi:MAG TPA: choice-of-anchor Q domain-containing protein [Candidatus Acidoferrales bacterium]|nr:choice-of-anchor Q domain-containing protein [Candidatus Acidoferrales bacterium]